MTSGYEFSGCYSLLSECLSSHIIYLPLFYSTGADVDILSEYVFPLASPFLSAALGAIAAYLAFNSQDKLKVEKNKIDSINKLILDAESARSNLIAIKHNYVGTLESHPIQRLLAIPSILIDVDKLSENMHELSFLASSGKDSSVHWCNILKIKAMFHNYNSLLTFWSKRDELNEEMRMKLRDKIDGPMMRRLSEDEILETLGVAFLIAIVDINERVIALTDDLIISFDNFLKDFPKEAERYISKRVGKRYGGVLKYENSVDKEMLNVLTKSPSVNFELMGDLMNEDPEIMAKRYKHT